MSKWNYTNREDKEEYEEYTKQLFQDSPPLLSDHFTEQVMKNIRVTEMDSERGITLTKLSGIRRSRRLNGLKWGSIVTAGIVALSLLITFEDFAPSNKMTSRAPFASLMFSHEQVGLDPSLMKVHELGLDQQANLSVTDNGYTIVLNDVIADPTRLVLAIQVLDKNGQSIADAASIIDYNQLHIRNKTGKEIGKLISTIPMYDRQYNDKSGQLYTMLTYYFPEESPGDTILIQSEIKELYKPHNRKDKVKGDWSFSYTADMSKANRLSVTTNLNEAYTTPTGLHVKLDQLVRSPAGAQLKFTTSLSKTAADRTPKELRGSLGVMYHLDGQNGEEILRVNSYKDGGYPDRYFAYTVEENQQTDSLLWTYYLSFLPYDQSNVRFVMDGYYIPEESHDSITFQPDKLEQQPAIFNKQGDHLEIHDLKITETKDEPGISGWMAVSGTFINHFNADQWIAYDQEGRKYNIVFRGILSLTEKIKISEPGSENSPSFLIVKGLTSTPRELTLVRTITDKKYTNVDWSVELPNE